MPGSWKRNTLTDSRDYLDEVWHETKTFVPQGWISEEASGFGWVSVNYHAAARVNGQRLGIHEGGHFTLCFWRYPKPSNPGMKTTHHRSGRKLKLKPNRVPTGNVPKGFLTNYPKANFDFFLMLGSTEKHGSSTLPKKAKIKDITVKKPDFKNTLGKISIEIETNSEQQNPVKLLAAGRESSTHQIL